VATVLYGARAEPDEAGGRGTATPAGLELPANGETASRSPAGKRSVVADDPPAGEDNPEMAPNCEKSGSFVLGPPPSKRADSRNWVAFADSIEDVGPMTTKRYAYGGM
jgi:hypothetical protein